MTVELVSVGVLIVLAIGLVSYWRFVMSGHQRRLEQLEVRVHVNGTRGKSTVTRLVAAVLREGGYVTVAKTTGSAARVIESDGQETVIKRRGAPTINEQVDVVGRYVTGGVDALVIECMAVRPLYQQYSQDFMVRSGITIITNVREDHQEEMGETLEEIANSMSVTIPRDGVLITAEERPDLRGRLRRHAEARGSRLIYADPAQVLDDDLRGFDYQQFKGNVAIGLAVANLLSVDRDVALEAMWRSTPDVGAVRMATYDIGGKRILWVPIFAANDRQSVLLTLDELKVHFAPGATVIGILNNRSDRGRRAELFADMVPQDLAEMLDHVVTFGAYEDSVTRRMVDQGFPRERIHKMGETTSPTLGQILATFADLVEGGHGVLIGMANIHTHQAEMLMEHFAELDAEPAAGGEDAGSDPVDLPRAATGIRRTAGHRQRRARSA